MVLNPLNVLKKGLKTLRNQVKTKKEQLQTWLAEGKSISSQEEKWLDGEANFIDEDHVLEALELASDYEWGLERLDEEQMGLVTKLRHAAGDIIKVAGSKRKRACFLFRFLCLAMIDVVKVLSISSVPVRWIRPLHLFLRRRRMPHWNNASRS